MYSDQWAVLPAFHLAWSLPFVSMVFRWYEIMTDIFEKIPVKNY